MRRNPTAKLGGGESASREGSRGEIYLDAEHQLLPEEIVARLAMYKPPEWEEFLLLLVR